MSRSRNTVSAPMARNRAGRPFVLINMAMSADGKIATANRKVSSFGSRRDHDHLLELRATADAVMAGARTVDSNPVNLGPGPARYRRMRLRRGLAEYNLRVIVTGSSTLDRNAAIFKKAFSPVLVLTTARAGAHRLKKLRSLATEVKVCGKDQINFRQALEWLRCKWGVLRLLCEGGGELNDALFRAGLVDELHLTVCPFVFGGRTAPTIADGIGAGSLARASALDLVSMQRTSAEMYLVFRAARKSNSRSSVSP